MKKKTGYSIYSKKVQQRTLVNKLRDLYPPLPNEKFDYIFSSHCLFLRSFKEDGKKTKKLCG